MNKVMCLGILVLNMFVHKNNANKHPQHEPLAHSGFISDAGSYTGSSASIAKFYLV